VVLLCGGVIVAVALKGIASVAFGYVIAAARVRLCNVKLLLPELLVVIVVAAIRIPRLSASHKVMILLCPSPPLQIEEDHPILYRVTLWACSFRLLKKKKTKKKKQFHY
jgi:ABC-type dipeptide/oligopeptide/nickel transport system permease subunit